MEFTNQVKGDPKQGKVQSIKFKGAGGGQLSD